jgi:hypothetical protein
MDHRDATYDQVRPPSLSAYRARYRRSLKYSAATITVYAFDQDTRAVTSWTAFTGQYVGATQDEPGVWQLRIQVKSNPLTFQKCPREKVTLDVWPNAHADALAKPVPIVYGEHSAQNLTGTGMLPTLYVDTSNYIHLVSLGWISSVPRVYLDGVGKSIGGGGDCTIVYYDTNGVWWTGVKWASDPGDAACTVDAVGLTDTSNGTGSVITNQIAQARHMLTHFFFDRWRRGDWFTESAFIDSDLADAAQSAVDDLGGVSARYLGEEKSGDGWLEEICASVGVKSLWTEEGKVGFAILRPPSDANYDAEWVQGDTDDYSPFSEEDDFFDPLREIELKYQHGEVAGDYYSSLKLIEPRVTDRTDSTVELAWSDSGS